MAPTAEEIDQINQGIRPLIKPKGTTPTKIQPIGGTPSANGLTLEEEEEQLLQYRLGRRRAVTGDQDTSTATEAGDEEDEADEAAGDSGPSAEAIDALVANGWTHADAIKALTLRTERKKVTRPTSKATVPSSDMEDDETPAATITDSSIDTDMFDRIEEESTGTGTSKSKAEPATAQAPTEMTESIEEELTSKGGETKLKGDSMDMLDDVTASVMEEEPSGDQDDGAGLDMLEDTSAFDGRADQEGGEEGGAQTSGDMMFTELEQGVGDDIPLATQRKTSSEASELDPHILAGVEQENTEKGRPAPVETGAGNALDGIAEEKEIAASGSLEEAAGGDAPVFVADGGRDTTEDEAPAGRFEEGPDGIPIWVSDTARTPASTPLVDADVAEALADIRAQQQDASTEDAPAEHLQGEIAARDFRQRGQPLDSDSPLVTNWQDSASMDTGEVSPATPTPTPTPMPTPAPTPAASTETGPDEPTGPGPQWVELPNGGRLYVPEDPGRYGEDHEPGWNPIGALFALRVKPVGLGVGAASVAAGAGGDIRVGPNNPNQTEVWWEGDVRRAKAKGGKHEKNLLTDIAGVTVPESIPVVGGTRFGFGLIDVPFGAGGLRGGVRALIKAGSAAKGGVQKTTQKTLNQKFMQEWAEQLAKEKRIRDLYTSGKLTDKTVDAGKAIQEAEMAGAWDAIGAGQPPPKGTPVIPNAPTLNATKAKTYATLNKRPPEVA